VTGPITQPAQEVPAEQRVTPPAVAATSVTKTFRLPHQRYSTVRERATHPFRPASYEQLVALSDVSFDVAPGEFLGLVGANGSGKSTLLKCIAGIYPVDAGEIATRGRVAPFIELGVGFDPEMPARDNVIANALMLGLTPRQARERFDEIVAFAELQDFVDLKLKNYSSGMVVRLAFSVSVQIDADVLLFDEVLAVGDASFQRRCLARFERLREEGRTVLLVTHDMDTVRQFCDRALLLHGGEVVDAGDPARVARRYEELGEHRLAAHVAPRPAARRRGRHGRPARGRTRREGGARRDQVRQLFTVTRELAIAQFKLRYFDSALSYFWAVMRPLAIFAVLYLFVTQVARFDNGVEHYPVYLLTALVLWTYFDQATSTAVHSLVVRESLLRKVPLVRAAIPLSVVVASLFDLCMNLIAVAALLFASGIEPRVEWLEMPVLILILSLLVAGVAMLLSVLYVRLRDVDQIWLVATQALFFGTPIFYVIASLPEDAHTVALSNPLAALLTEMRHALIDPAAPSAAEAIGGAALLSIPIAITVGILSLGALAFRHESPRIAERL
jgi:ABC-type polysaccharide/polyol phosphate transport system ATPase subunit/ABC-type polysaccharide/polyol phosphate export permease